MFIYLHHSPLKAARVIFLFIIVNNKHWYWCALLQFSSVIKWERKKWGMRTRLGIFYWIIYFPIYLFIFFLIRGVLFITMNNEEDHWYTLVQFSRVIKWRKNWRVWKQVCVVYFIYLFFFFFMCDVRQGNRWMSIFMKRERCH